MSEALATLGFLTLSLSHGCQAAQIDMLHHAIRTGKICWEAVINLADDSLITPALWIGIREKGLSERLPESVRQHLQEIHRLNKHRNRQLRTQLEEVVTRLNQIGVKPVLLKGAVHLFSRNLSDAAGRIMTDLDILVPRNRLSDCVQALQASGYAADNNDIQRYADHHHYAPLFRPGEYAAVELHQRLLNSAADKLLSTKSLWRNIESIEHPRLKLSAPTPTYRILHNLLHSEIVDRHYPDGKIDLRALHELVYLEAAFKNAVDWQFIQAHMDSLGKTAVLQTYLHTGKHLFNMTVPNACAPEFKSRLQTLRRLYKVRWRWFHLFDSKAQLFSDYHILRRFRCEDNSRSRAHHRIVLVGQLFVNGLHRLFGVCENTNHTSR